MTRPHWLPDEVWLGLRIGEWPIQAFPTQDMAARWAAEDPKRRIWAVQILNSTPTYAVETVPAAIRLKETGA